VSRVARNKDLRRRLTEHCLRLPFLVKLPNFRYEIVQGRARVTDVQRSEASFASISPVVFFRCLLIQIIKVGKQSWFSRALIICIRATHFPAQI
jgi:hypothetical protein